MRSPSVALLLLASLATAICDAQVVFDSHYDVGYNNDITVRGVATADGGLMVSARPTGDSVQHFEGAILTTDNMGNVVSLLRYEDGGSDLISCMERTMNGEVVVGSLTSGHFDHPDATDIMIRKIQGDGDIDWAKAYAVDGQYHANLYDIVQTEPEMFIGLGSFSQDGGGAQPLLFKFTGSGDVLWVRGLYTVNGGLQCLSLTLDPAGGVIASGLYASVANGSKMVIVHVDLDGNVEWSHWYGSTGYSNASKTLIRPDGGLAILGRLGGANWVDGAVVRTDTDGTPLSMFTWGFEIQDGHCFSDGSMMVICDGYDAETAVARIDTGNMILWSTLLDATSFGEFVPLGGDTRFAYVSSELLGDVTINTLTDQCEACNDDTIPFTDVTDTWADDGPLEVTAVPMSMTSADIGMTPVLLSAIMAPQCMLYVGVNDQVRPEVAGLKCAYSASDHRLSLTGLGSRAGSIVVCDMLGHQWSSSAEDAITTDDRAMHMAMPSELGPGYYVATVQPGKATCAFIVQPN
jgi:hypothetical protein